DEVKTEEELLKEFKEITDGGKEMIFRDELESFMLAQLLMTVEENEIEYFTSERVIIREGDFFRIKAVGGVVFNGVTKAENFVLPNPEFVYGIVLSNFNRGMKGLEDELMKLGVTDLDIKQMWKEYLEGGNK